MSENTQKDMIPHCKHFVIRKKRFCRMTVKSGYEYCGEHQPKIESSSTSQVISNDPRLRIPCPLDSKQFVYKLNIKYNYNSIKYMFSALVMQIN